MTRHPSPRDGLLRRLRTLRDDIAESRPDVAARIDDALAAFEAECDDAAEADAVEYAAMRAEVGDNEVMW